MSSLDIRTQRDLLASLVLGLRGLRTAQCHVLIRSAELDGKHLAADKIYRCQHLIECVAARLDELILPGLPTTFRIDTVASWCRACIAAGITRDAIDMFARRLAELAERMLAMSCVTLDAPTRDALALVVNTLPCDHRAGRDARPLEPCGRAATVRDVEAAIAWPEVAASPGRPAGLSLRSKQECSDDLAEKLFQAPSSEAADDMMLRHGLHGLLFNVEIAAMESCAMILARFQDVPEACAHDLARQCWDESRHAQICWSQLIQRGGSLNEFPIHLAIWDKARRGSSAAECLCLQQVLGEGFALGQGLRFQNEFRARGETALSELHERLFFDELLHVRNGVRWFRELAGSSAADMYRRIAAQLGRGVDLTVGDEIVEFALLRDIPAPGDVSGSH